MFFLNIAVCHAQKQHFDTVLNALNSNNYEQAKKQLHIIDTTQLNKFDKATWLYYYASLSLNLDKNDLAYKSIIQAKKAFKSLQKVDDVADCNMLLLEIISHQNNLSINTDAILKDLESYAMSKKNDKALISLYHRLAVKYIKLNDANNAILYFNKIIQIAIKNKDSVLIGHAYTNIGVVHAIVNHSPDSSLYYNKKAVPILIKHKDIQVLAYNYNNQAQQYKTLIQYNKAALYYKKSDSLPLTKNKAKTKVIFYTNMTELYQLNKDYKNASYYAMKLNALKDSINSTRQNIAISEIKEKYDNEKLRADKLELEAKRLQNRNYLIATLSLLLLGSILSFFIFKNSKKKRLLAEKDKEIEHQKVTSLLKEQELIGINAMVVGQEKERKRIAEDLHDDIGSALTTLKLHLENFKYNKEKDAFSEEKMLQDTGKLLDETYLKVRSMAHAKNSGVFANQGLLVAVQNMANKIASANKLSIEVIDFGLDKRIDNTLELTSFRIIQELITNIIKHAQATTASIQLNLFDDMLNIIIEDNGIGFDINTIKLKQGMGLQSIKTRIEHLEGSFEVDSKKGKGSTFIINLPI